MPSPYALLAALVLPAAGVIGPAAPAPSSKPPVIAPQTPLQKKQPLARRPFLMPHTKLDYVIVPPPGVHCYILLVLPPKNERF